MSTLTVPQDVAEPELSEEERQRRITAYYEREIQKGLDSGPPIPMTPDFWDKLREEAHQRRAARKTSAESRNT